MRLQLYLHFPFCKRKCFYCDFCSRPASPEEMEGYCQRLIREIREEGARWPETRVSTIFLGGGTPSLVPAKSMGRVLDALFSVFAVDKDAEFTSEANPGTLCQEWLDCLLSFGLNRLSLGVQAAQDGLLKSVGRIHTFAEAREAVALSRRAGIENLNCDLMFALPGQTLTDYRETLEAVMALSPTHLSAYSLIVEENTPLGREVASGKLSVPDDDAAADFYQLGLETLQKGGYRQYEISNFAKEGFLCRHNVGYWQGEWYLGLGVSAHGMLPPARAEAEAGAVRARVANPEDGNAYLNGQPGERQLIGPREAMFETMMLGLRMNEGVSDDAFRARFGLSLREAYAPALRSLERDGLGAWRDRFFALTPRGLLLQNDAALRFMGEGFEGFMNNP